MDERQNDNQTVQPTEVPPIMPVASVGMSIATKVIIGVITVAVLGGGGYVGYTKLTDSKSEIIKTVESPPTSTVVASNTECTDIDSRLSAKGRWINSDVGYKICGPAGWVINTSPDYDFVRDKSDLRFMYGKELGPEASPIVAVSVRGFALYDEADSTVSKPATLADAKEFLLSETRQLYADSPDSIIMVTSNTIKKGSLEFIRTEVIDTTGLQIYSNTLYDSSRKLLYIVRIDYNEKLNTTFTKDEAYSLLDAIFESLKY